MSRPPSRTQVAVVGAGVAGCLLAYRLARAGREVVVLEAGSRVVRREAVNHYRRDPYRGISSPYPEQSLAPRPTLDDLQHHYLQSGPDLFMGLYERGVGGSTWHWLGTTLRMLAEDFRMRTLYGVGEDWPLSLEELASYYTEAEAELGVAGPPPAPLPPHPLSQVDLAVADACRSLGLEFQALPQARNSVRYQDRPACCGNASCVPICPIGAKYDGSVHAALAERAGARLFPDTAVVNVHAGPDGLVRELVYRQEKGPEGRLSADVFVLAANGVETPRLLLHSGLANSSDAVGRYLMGGSAVLSWGLAPTAVHPRQGPQASMGLPGQRGGPHRSIRSGFMTAVASDGWPHGSPSALLPGMLARGLRGKQLKSALTDHLARQVALVSTCEELPDAANRVLCDARFPDALGVGRPRIQYRIGDYTRRGLPAAQETHAAVLAGMGADKVGHQHPAADSAYLLGTTRMGNDPASSVVNADLRCHDHPNLYLLGGSVFPTTGSAPPTLTVAALALRLADFLLAAGNDPVR